MTNAAASQTLPPGDEPEAMPFRSMGELRRAHEALLEQLGDHETANPGEIVAFVSRAVETGRSLARATDRRAAQGFIDYWVGILVRARRHASRPSDELLVQSLAPLEVERINAITMSADEALARVGRGRDGKAPEDVAKRLLLSLFQPEAAGQSFEPAPPRPRAELLKADVVGTTDAALARDVLEALLRAGALQEGDQGVEIADDALSVLWPRLSTVLQDRAQFRLIVEYWDRNDRAAGAVLSTELIQRAAPRAGLDKLEREFADTAVQQANAERRRYAQWLWSVSVLAVAAIVAAMVAFWQWQYASAEAKLARHSEQEARDAQEQVERLNRDLEVRLTAAVDRNRARDAVIQFLEDLRRRGVLQTSDMPPAVAQLLPIEAPSTTAGRVTPSPGQSEAMSVQGAGYDPNFLGDVTVPLPSMRSNPTENISATADLLRYPHFSIALHRERRIALFAASNFNRAHRIAIEPETTPFFPDPRIPLSVQPDPDLFDQPGVDRGRLVSRGEVSWGIASDDGPTASSEATAAFTATSAFPNLVPQWSSFNQGPWASLDRWLLVDHNPSALRVLLFAGPILDSDDPRMQEGQVPRRFWRIAVSRRSEVPGSLVVDAFVLEQPPLNLPASVVPSVPFSPPNQRVSVEEIEALTGLDFGPLRVAEQVQARAETVPGSDLAALVPSLDADQLQVRTQVTQRLVSALRDGSASPAEQRTLAAALVNEMQDDRLSKPDAAGRYKTAAGRYNLLFVLSEIPAERWRQPDWQSLAQELRMNLANLNQRANRGATQIGASTRRLMNQLSDRLNAPLANDLTVFAHIGDNADREAVMAIVQRLGDRFPPADVEYVPAWGESQRTRGQVRYYRPSQAEAARDLASRLRAVTRELTGVDVAFDAVDISRTFPNLPDGRIEVWFPRIGCRPTSLSRCN